MKKIILTICGLSIFFALTVPVFAQVGIPDYLKPENLPGASRDSGLPEEAAIDYSVSGIQFIIGDIISIILLISGVIAVFSIVNNAWYMIISMGKGENFDQRKKALYWAIGGLVLILTSYIIIKFVVQFATTAFQEAPAAPAAPQQQEDVTEEGLDAELDADYEQALDEYGDSSPVPQNEVQASGGFGPASGGGTPGRDTD